MSLLTTPTQGKDEVLRALRGLCASHGRFVAPRTLRRELGPRATVADITTALTSLHGDPRLTDDGAGKFSLTVAGVAYARVHRPYRRFADT